MLGLYVHIPFCSVKCYYCDFAAFSGQGRTAARYLKALEREAELYSDLKPETLYIGGGTPSELSAEELSGLMRLVSSRFGPAAALRESTFEANPESLSPEKLDVLRSAGISRISLGLQTAQPWLLKTIGRRHTIQDFMRVFSEVRSRGFALNVDLMIGLPGQDFGDALESLDRVLDLGPEHLSLYSLQVEDRTLFGRRGVEVDEDLCREMMEASLAVLARAGYRHYEISNFALPGHESLHNTNYWLDGPYLGLGCGAAGHLDGVRYQNEDRLLPYCAQVESGARPWAFSESLAGKEKVGETMMLGLRRLEGLTLTPKMRSFFRREIERLLNKGLLRLEDAGCSRGLPRLRLSRRGLFLANMVFREFVSPYAEALTP